MTALLRDARRYAGVCGWTGDVYLGVAVRFVTDADPARYDPSQRKVGELGSSIAIPPV